MKSAIIGTLLLVVEVGFERFEQARQGEAGKRTGAGRAERTIVHQVYRQDETLVEGGVQGIDMRGRDIHHGKIVATIMLPDQAERAVGRLVLAQRRAALVMIEDLFFCIISAADVIDDAIAAGRDPLRRAAADDLRLGEQPGQDDAGEEFIGMEATGMGDEIIWFHAGMRLCWFVSSQFRTQNRFPLLLELL
ncbi:hypothetical protein D3C80_251500 [compost metagenome]